MRKITNRKNKRNEKYKTKKGKDLHWKKKQNLKQLLMNRN